MTQPVAITCRWCQSSIPAGDQFCPNCGKKLTDLDLKIGASLEPAPALDRPHVIRKAVKWMIALGVMFILFGTFFGVKNYSEASTAINVLRNFDDDMTWPEPLDGKTVTVAQLRQRVYFEMYSIFVLNYLLALAMFGLSFWARKSPFPAMITALCLYLAVNVLNAIVDPATIAQGWLIKILFFGAMIAGIKASLVARAQERLDSPPAGSSG